MDIALVHNGIDVLIVDGPYLHDGSPTPLAVAHYTQLTARLDDIRRFAATQLLAVYNDTWRDVAIGPLTEHGFITRLRNPAIHLYDEIGHSVVYFADGSMFAGHTVRVTVEHGVPQHATI